MSNSGDLEARMREISSGAERHDGLTGYRTENYLGGALRIEPVGEGNQSAVWDFAARLDRASLSEGFLFEPFDASDDHGRHYFCRPGFDEPRVPYRGREGKYFGASEWQKMLQRRDQEPVSRAALERWEQRGQRAAYVVITGWSTPYAAGGASYERTFVLLPFKALYTCLSTGGDHGLLDAMARHLLSLK